MLSRLAHLMVIDILAVGVMLKKGNQAMDRMRRMKESLMQIKYSSVDEESEE
jgi:DNA-binding MurR/RpiR family transcriptional regulator